MPVRQVDCMACLAEGIALPMGIVDRIGITHYVKWHVGKSLRGCYRLCDFEGETLSKGKTAVDVTKLVSVEEP